MGKLIKIKDLATKMITLSGKTVRDKKNPLGDIEIKYIGLRPGEKLYEEVLIGNNPEKTENEEYYINESFMSFQDLTINLKKLKAMYENDINEIKYYKDIVIDYYPNVKNVDWLK